MDSLFEYDDSKKPLAYRMRPKNIEEFIGQEHIIKIIKSFIIKDTFMNSIFYGPAGTGKTTLANIIANNLGYNYEYLNAIKSSVSDIKEISNKARELYVSTGQQTILLFDEIHRFNKLQQDSFLQDLENGNIILIGATTENPYYNLNNSLLSRCMIFQFKDLRNNDIEKILMNILNKEKEELANNFLEYIVKISDGDARYAINMLEMTLKIKDTLMFEDFKEVIGNNKKYDKIEDKYDTISAFIKSIRGSDPDSAVYWLAKMLELGEDIEYIARRLVILSSEDIGLANPNALNIATSGMTAIQNIGMPEARIILAEVTIYLATSPKSNSAYKAINKAIDIVKNTKIEEVPKHLTKLGKDSYLYPHNYSKNYIDQKYNNKDYDLYNYGDNKFETAAKEYMNNIKDKTK